MLPIPYSACRFAFKKCWKTWRNARQFSATMLSVVFSCWQVVWTFFVTFLMIWSPFRCHFSILNLIWNALGPFTGQFFNSWWLWVPKTSNWRGQLDPIFRPFSIYFVKMTRFFFTCFLDIVFRWFFNARKGRQEGSRASGSIDSTFAPMLPKMSKWDHFETPFESICSLKSCTGRHQNSRTRTRDMNTPPPIPPPPVLRREVRAYGWQGKARTKTAFY